MKQIKLLIGTLIMSSSLFAQEPPQGVPPGAGVAAKANAAWYRGGNFPIGTVPPDANIFGTMAGFNSPIYTYTNGIGRMKLNGDIVYSLPGTGNNTRNGFLLLTNSAAGAASQAYNNNNFGAFSLLHLIGDDGPFLQTAGYRDWMRNGILLSNNFDAGFIGVRKMPSTGANGDDVSDFVINWSDNPGVTPGSQTPDNLVFCFTGFDDMSGFGDLAGDGLYGREMMRMNTNGNIGIGPRFDNNNQPKSTLHQHQENYTSSWIQVTNQSLTTGGILSGPTPIFNYNGFRLGILGSSSTVQNGNALVYQQENKHLLFSTNANTNNITPLNTLERMRITSIGAPTELAGGGYAPYNPANLGVNGTRVSISRDPANPVTRPLSLLHLGYNTGQVGFPPGSTDGWRSWMDIGTFTSNGTDNMYVGLKQETGGIPGSDRNDAVINWGDNSGGNPFNGPDNLRFIFTETTTGSGGNPPATDPNGLEVARFVPTRASTLTGTNYGMMGIGNFYNGAVPPVDAKLDIDGDLRIREVTQRDTLERVLVIDEMDHNRVHWRDVNSLTLGNLCGGTTNPLTGDYEINLNTHNLNIHNTIGNVNIGDVNCNTPSVGRVFIRNSAGQSPQTVALFVESSTIGTAGVFNGADMGLEVNTISGTGPNTIGIFSNASGAPVFAVGVGGVASNAGSRNVGVRGVANGPSTVDNFGVMGVAGNSTGLNYAGYFNGDVNVTGTVYANNGLNSLSDAMFKQNIQNVNNARAIINQLIPRTFNLDSANFTQFGFDTKQHIGLIAQEVEPILPDLVTNTIMPAEYDTSGNLTHAALNYKALDYQQFIPLLIAGIKEQQTEIDSLEGVIANQDSINTNLEDRLAALEQCLSENNLCNGHARLNNSENDGKVIQLENLNAIILDQNLPNPFAEKTTITYSIPDEVTEAQLLFYDMNGRIIKQVDINERGQGQLTVYGENLQKGIYTYSLIADGKLIATKKMVKQ